jgi:predicted  nucleic acid-binding Zn-ribbon protein
MIDAALSITQSRVEQFAESYLTTLGCEIDKRGDLWELTIPDTVELPVDKPEITCGDSSMDEPDKIPDLHPESEYFQQLLEHASDNAPVGKTTISATDSDLIYPEWITESSVSVEDASFTVYYDRIAIVVLFRISIETVSEYQTAFLRATAVDTHSEETLPELAKTYLARSVPGEKAVDIGAPQLDRTTVEPSLAVARETVLERIQPEIDDIHQKASQAADAEIEEYRQMQQQRIDELVSDRATLSERIDELSDDIETGTDQSEHVELLKERKELKTEYEEVENELQDLKQRRERGYPEYQQEVRARHALDVAVTPVTLTEVEYERGEIAFRLTVNSREDSISLGYGSGVGTIEEVTCGACGRALSGGRPLAQLDAGPCCADCHSSSF